MSYLLPIPFSPWKTYNWLSRELSGVIQKNLLTEEAVTEVVNGRARVEFNRWVAGGGIWHFPQQSPELTIRISPLQPLQEQSLSLLHEVAHLYYGVLGNAHYLRTDSFGKRTENGLLEDLLQQEAQRFYGERKVFVDKLVRRLHEGVQLPLW